MHVNTIRLFLILLILLPTAASPAVAPKGDRLTPLSLHMQRQAAFNWALTYGLAVVPELGTPVPWFFTTCPVRFAPGPVQVIRYRGRYDIIRTSPCDEVGEGGYFPRYARTF